MTSKPIIDAINQLFEGAGVFALVVGVLVTGINYVNILLRKPGGSSLAYSYLRKGFGRAILVGLELLVAADIIRTVAIEPTLQNVATLGLIVIIRTLLSWSLEVEINGQWPWQRKRVPETMISPGGDEV